MMPIVVDASVLSAPKSGVGVYLSELLARLTTEFAHDFALTLRPEPATEKGPGSLSRKGTGEDFGAKRDRGAIRGLVRRVPGAYAARQVAIGWPPTRALFWGTNFVLPPKWLARGMTVVSVHDLLFVEHREWADKTRGAFLRRALPGTLDRADAIIVSTARTKRTLIDRYGSDLADRTYVVANGIRTLGDTAPDPNARAVVCVGNIELRKDPMCLLDAHRALPPHVRREHPLIFAGGALDDAYAAAFARALDPPHARWLGTIDDAALADLLRSARVLVTPTRAEGFGIVPLEALAAGVAVLASDIAVTRELAGDLPSYFPPGDVAALTALLGAALERPRTPSDAERQALRRKYDWNAVAARHAEIFKTLS